MFYEILSFSGVGSDSELMNLSRILTPGGSIIVFYVSGRLWEDHLYVFYVFGEGLDGRMYNGAQSAGGSSEALGADFPWAGLPAEPVSERARWMQKWFSF